MLHKAVMFDSKIRPRKRQSKQAEDAKRANRLLSIISTMKKPC